MNTTLQTPARKQELEDLLRRNHSLNGGIPDGVDVRSVEIQARAMQVLSGPTPWIKAVGITGMATGAMFKVMGRIVGAFAKLQIPDPEVGILINLEPADILKDGTWLELPIAITLLQAAGVLRDLPDHLQGDYFLMGGVDIHGQVRHVPRAICLASSTVPGQMLIVPASNEKDRSFILALPGYGASRVCAVSLLSDVIELFKGEREWSSVPPPQFHDEGVRQPLENNLPRVG